MGERQRHPPGLASQKFFWGCEGLVIVVSSSSRSTHLVFLPFPPFPVPLPSPFTFPLTFPFCSSPSLSLSTRAFFALVAPAPADDVVRFLVGERLQPLRVVEAVERVAGMLKLGRCWYVVVACGEDGGSNG